jgi:hypothetical protein
MKNNQLFPLNQFLAVDSKSTTTGTPKISANSLHISLATQQLKNRCATDSSSLQKGEDGSSIFLLLARLSLVNVLLLANSHKNMCNLEGAGIFHKTGVYTCLNPLKLTIAYKDWTKYFP